ncbi:MAG: metallophosphoesterase family protein [Candidatus Limnocylindrales bacterium]|jgi:predicted phosphodiesterase
MLVAVLSDIHSNLRALDAVLGSLGTVDAVWQLGDVVGYGPEPDGVVERLGEVRAIGVKGNHDDAVCGGGSIEGFNPDARAAAEWTRAHVVGTTIEYLSHLPVELTPAGTDFTLVHGSPRDPIWEYLDSTLAARENLAVLKTRNCLVGHTHVPLVFRDQHGHIQGTVVEPESRLTLDERRVVLNPGSVGQPRDGDPTASYMILDTTAGHATWQRVAYDIGSTQASMLAAGLPARLARRLSFGQ